MTDLHEILGGRPGVYDWRSSREAADLRAEVERAGWRFVHLDATGVAGKDAFLDRAATAFGFPEWFGRNWDALADSLGDVRSEPGVVVLWDGWRDLAHADDGAFAIAVDVLRERAKSRLGGDFVVLVRHDG